MHPKGNSSPASYGRFLTLIAGLGGLLYGIDIGIIAAALLYLGKTIKLSEGQTSVIVAAVFAGSTLSSFVAGFVADWIGRKKTMVISGILFVISVLVIVLSQGFSSLLVGRLLQGVSCGVIAVVVPLYLAECLSVGSRGKGSANFQLMLTVGIALAAVVGTYYASKADEAIRLAAGNADLIRAAQDHAWRSIFMTAVYPGVAFFVGALFLSESPRWLFLKGRQDAALAALRRTSTEEEAQLQLREMRELSGETQEQEKTQGVAGSLLQRKYVFPFVLACVILACNQATGINSILSYLVLILRQAGMSASHATQGDVVVKVLNCVMTVVAMTLIDRRGRKFLLSLGTGGIVVGLLLAGIFFYGFEAKRADVLPQVKAAVQNRSVMLPLSALGSNNTGRPSVLTVLYNYGQGDQVASVLSDDADPVLKIAPDVKTPSSAVLQIKQASYGAIPAEQTGWLVTACIALFIACYAVGPGVVVWLALSELMPTRIRSAGMGIALLLNQGVSMLIAGVFLPVVGRYGYYAIFFFWTVCTVIYFLTAFFFLPETKGKSLEEIERYFDSGNAKAA